MKRSEKQKGKEHEEQNRQLRLIIGGVMAALILVTLGGYLFFNPFVAKSGNMVAVYYTGSLDNGTVVESNLHTTPFIFTIGKEETIPYGLGDAVIGMKQNETRTVVLPPERAFGNYDPSLVQVVNRSSLPADTGIEAGQDYQIRRKPDNAVAHVRIIDVTPDTVTWDANSPLAGENLTLELTLIQIVK